jgi:multiple sugar transport system substrate-binding protein
VTFLSDDLLEGRESGTRGHEIAARYIASQFALLGLKPAGENGGWFQPVGLAEASLDPKTSKVSDSLVFGMMPGTKGADGKLVRWSNIGGQPFVLTTWTTDAQIKEAVEFVKWWLSSNIQHQYAAAGGQSAIKSVYSDPKYVTYRPWNRTWAPSLEWQKDVWHVPQFFELLTQQQDQYDLAITGRQDAKTTQDSIAKFQQRLLTEAGLSK